MRKYKQVKRKEIVYDLKERKIIEDRAASISVKTGVYIKRMSLDGKIISHNFEQIAPLMNALRIIAGNINQIAKKANETNSIYSGDMQNFKTDYEALCHVLSKFLLGKLPALPEGYGQR